MVETADGLYPFGASQASGRKAGGLRGIYGELPGKGKSCFALILKDRQPGKEPGGYETCQAYVDELPKRRKQMWPDNGRKGEKDG